MVMAPYDEKIAAGRQPCVIPGCRRTFKPEGHRETICRNHWLMVPSSRRRVYSRVRKAWEHAASVYSGLAQVAGDHRAKFEAAEQEFLRIDNRADRLWERIKRQIIERAVGI
jgi:hypothetical protein